MADGHDMMKSYSALLSQLVILQSSIFQRFPYEYQLWILLSQWQKITLFGQNMLEKSKFF
jgi:hypothetical protein